MIGQNDCPHFPRLFLSFKSHDFTPLTKSCTYFAGEISTTYAVSLIKNRYSQPFNNFKVSQFSSDLFRSPHLRTSEQLLSY